jgi:hypothetical protein
VAKAATLPEVQEIPREVLLLEMPLEELAEEWAEHLVQETRVVELAAWVVLAQKPALVAVLWGVSSEARSLLGLY